MEIYKFFVQMPKKNPPPPPPMDGLVSYPFKFPLILYCIHKPIKLILLQGVFIARYIL